jgi:putative drug exporter of the RND superfamily
MTACRSPLLALNLFGTSSWWIPRWLDRILPRINVEGQPEEAARTPVK